jgi:hypothetical protein
MITIVNPVYQNPLLRRSQPQMGQTPLPIVSPSSGPGKIAAGIGVGVVTLGLGAVSTLFLYGIAKESKSKMVKTTGYIMAALTGLATAVEAVGAGTLIAKA